MHAELRFGLHLQDIEFAYPRSAVLVSAPDLHVPQGEVHGIIGPSGAGKSTLLRLIAGLQVPTRGTITINGARVAAPGRHVPTEDRGVGFVFQDCQLFPHLSARRNIAFGLAGVARRERARLVDQLLERLGLAERAEAKPHQLSGGEQQRVAVARALARGPAIMLMDEPFRSLDAETAASTRQMVMSEVRAAGIATIVVTHDVHEAYEIADRVWMLSRGATAGSATAPARLAPASRREFATP